ncbi:hypothetical protein [Halosolutus gelatinilyticus]|uniref:hypothetical protein n=1 Tax=Halosolutus gelatinilyticus TaxID=2931975 RepID=UPI001FF42FF8|nr:hypothetical protein [Halosolutus gelatinilyticus]
MIRSRSVLILSGLVAVALLATIAHPAALAAPYHEQTPSYAVAHESTDAFDETVEEGEFDVDDPTPVSDLSPVTQRAFEEATDQPADPGSEYRGAGWRSHPGVTICNEDLHVCDEYEELPEFPNDGYADGSHSAYGVVEADGELYLVETTSGPYLSLPFATIFKSITFVPYALFLVFSATSRSRFRPEETTLLAGYGLAIVAFAFAYPYLVMFEYLPLAESVFVAIGCTWLLTIAGLEVHVRRYKKGDRVGA